MLDGNIGWRWTSSKYYVVVPLIWVKLESRKWNLWQSRAAPILCQSLAIDNRPFGWLVGWLICLYSMINGTPVTLPYVVSMEVMIAEKLPRSHLYIRKKGARTDPVNYRLISLKSVPCKGMESLIKYQVADYIDRNNILISHQHGFANFTRKDLVSQTYRKP